jgi:acetylornithine deacetylase/succinyl-diaminopimelate desuccinylase-like protein
VGGAARSNGQNDFAGADVKGKIALITGPAMPGGGNTVDNAFNEGAVGALVIGCAQIRYSYIPRFALPTIPTLVITETVANELLAPSGKTVRDIQAAVRGRRSDPGAPESGFDVATTVRMSVSLTPIHDVDAINVVGLLRAAKPETADRAVLVGGHLDGVGTDPDGSVFPAANDNASGTALTIEVARALTASRAALVHSVIFVAFAGEEQGFIGSESYITKSAVTPGRVESLIAMIDLDVIGCCGETLIVSNESPELQKRVRDAAARLGVPSQSSGGGGSDQVSFARRRVPAVFVGWSDAVLHTYRDAPGLVQASTLVKAGEVITQVTSELATND